MIVVTGAAGFIGSCIVARFNEYGRRDLLIVDHFADSLNPEGSSELKKQNLKGKKFLEYFDKKDFLDLIKTEQLDSRVNCIIHMGACSSTTLQDEKYFLENNFEYTRILAEYALKHKIRFIYASSAATYGDGSVGYKDDDETIRKCKPLNLYGQSKQKFDEWVLDHSVSDKMVGLKFFNVYGPNEYHKDEMRSVVAKAYREVVQKGRIKLFKSRRDDYADGEQKRDFIYIKDAVSIVMHFFEAPHINGIFNVGTGQAHTWNELAFALFRAIGKIPHIEYFDMPEGIKERYQYFTQADISKLRNSGYRHLFTDLEEAVFDYTQYLKTQKYL